MTRAAPFDRIPGNPNNPEAPFIPQHHPRPRGNVFRAQRQTYALYYRRYIIITTRELCSKLLLGGIHTYNIQQRVP